MAATAFIEGVAIWSPRLPGWDDAQQIFRGEKEVAQDCAPRPKPSLLPPAERRRAPDTVAVSLEVASRACTHAGRDTASLPSIFSSSHGDIATTDYMCETLAQSPTMLSPTKFHNSVHNAAAGYWAIATGCMAPYLALSANTYSFCNGLLTALVQAQTDNSDVLYVAYDTEAKGPVAAMAPSIGQLGCALVLSPKETSNSRFVVRWQTRNKEQAKEPTSGRFDTLVAGNAMASCLPFFEALSNQTGNVVCALGHGLSLCLEVKAIVHSSSQMQA